jgi:hypothetical protein
MARVRIIPRKSAWDHIFEPFFGPVNGVFANLEEAAKRGDIVHVGTIKARKLTDKESKVLKKLQKSMAEDALAEKCQGFMHENGRNIILREDPNEYENIRGKVNKKKLSKLGHKAFPLYVMVDTGLGTYRKLPTSTYKALCMIRYITLRIKLSALTDGEEEYYVFLDHTYKISSLNQLFHILNRREGLIDGLSVFHNGQGWFTPTKKKETMKILYKKNSIEVTTLEKFIKKYKLHN